MLQKKKVFSIRDIFQILTRHIYFPKFPRTVIFKGSARGASENWREYEKKIAKKKGIECIIILFFNNHISLNQRHITDVKVSNGT